MLILQLIVLSVVSACIWLEYRKWKIGKMIKNMVSPKQYPIVGIGHKFIGLDNEEVMSAVANICKDEGTPFSVWMGPMLVIGIARPEDMQTILSSNNCLQKGYMYKFVNNTTGIFSSDADLWKENRKLLNTTFNVKIRTVFTPEFNRKSQIMIDLLQNKINQSIDIYMIALKCTMDITINTVLSTEMDVQRNLNDDIPKAFIKFFECVAKRMFHFWERPDFIYKKTTAYCMEQKYYKIGRSLVDEIFTKKSKQLHDNLLNGTDIIKTELNSNTLTFIHKCFLMLQMGKWTEKMVLEQIETILAGGIDTSAITVTNTMQMLAIHQQEQEKCYMEIKSLNLSINDDITQEHISKLTYLQMCVQESLRLFPAGSYLARTCTEPLTLKNNVIPKNACILLLFDRMNRDKNIWGDDVNEFKPERFLPENIAKRHPWSFLPYSGGPRNCIAIKHGALSTKIMMVKLLQNFKFISNLKLNDIRCKMDITLRIINENAIQIKKR